MNIFNLTGQSYYRLDLYSILNIDRALMESRHHHYDIQGTLEDYLKFYSPHLGNHLLDEVAPGSFAYQYINQVPVFLVTKEQVGEYFDMDLVGHHLQFTVPNDHVPTGDLEADVESILGKEWEREGTSLDMPARTEKEGKGYEPFVGVMNIDAWGLYIGARRPIQNLRNAHPMIFIWVDKIQEHVESKYGGKSRYYHLLTSQVILHEMMHALMDINILAPHCANHNIPEWFRLLREESLAEAGSLLLMDGIWIKSDIEFLLEHISAPGRSFQYRLGSSYFKAGSNVVVHAIKNWLERKYNQKLAEDWLCYIKQVFPETDADQLDSYELGFITPNYVFRYQGRLYCYEEIVMQIIRDYAKSHQTSKSELMEAFPDTLNRYYDVFVDPQIKDHFTDKKNSSAEGRQIDEDCAVECSDGKLYVCGSWYFDFHRFVDHARDLGFDITDFPL